MRTELVVKGLYIGVISGVVVYSSVLYVKALHLAIQCMQKYLGG